MIPVLTTRCAGDVGTVIKIDHSAKPFEVKASNGKTWRYKSEALCAICDVAGCTRVTWNGEFGGQCCRTCKSSSGAGHGPDCEGKAAAAAAEKASEEAGAAKKAREAEVAALAAAEEEKKAKEAAAAAAKAAEEQRKAAEEAARRAEDDKKAKEREAAAAEEAIRRAKDEKEAKEALAHPKGVGSKVVLANNYAVFGDAEGGPLKPGISCPRRCRCAASLLMQPACCSRKRCMQGWVRAGVVDISAERSQPLTCHVVHSS